MPCCFYTLTGVSPTDTLKITTLPTPCLMTSAAGLSTMRDGVIRGLARTHPSLLPRRVEELLAAAQVDPVDDSAS